jgi:hypothetical protein
MKSVKSLAASLAALTVILSAGTAFAATGYAKGDVNVREGAGTDYDIVGHLSEGDEVEIIGCDDGWCETGEGYVAAGYLVLADAGDDDDDVEIFDHEEGVYDFDPYGITDDVPESLLDD